MDTALSLIEIKDPVYPLDIVQTMRDQRACMIQNAVKLEKFSFLHLKLTNESPFSEPVSFCL